MVFRADLDCVPSEKRSRVYSALRSQPGNAKSFGKVAIISAVEADELVSSALFLSPSPHAVRRVFPFSHGLASPAPLLIRVFLCKISYFPLRSLRSFAASPQKRPKVLASEICARENRSDVICYSIRSNEQIFRASNLRFYVIVDSPP